ncbi:Bug family tripartite tricarboxylate transporter substrate binding protein [Rhodoplanes sp. Z2-YC6860]|uniref:Bug family tripartite tricarboxylate transporter substrate binding protein n=1 Tax=Rhodoplanes sp. Z2-YC6860 TaxID=674703 RepID=UPI001F4499C2|nr:tripartite tricarboxylate transporter substrate binding protein [Rhodoplanes sp. Z2-YC6860]
MPRDLSAQQDYPSRPVRWVLGYTAGGTTDVISRLVTQPLSERLGQPFVIESRPGAGTNLATEYVVRSAPDGYTLLFVGAPNTINTALYSKLNFDFVRDIAPVGAIASVPMVLIVHLSIPATTLPEFIAYIRANPKKVNMASSGVGATPHLAGELFKMMADVDFQHVPYRGAAPALTDLLAGQVQFYFSTTPSCIEHVRAGRVRGLAVTTASRLDALPDLPTIGEFVKGYEATAWYGLGAPRQTPKPIVDQLNREINAVLAEPRMKARFDDLGCVLIAGSSDEFGKLIAEETEKWGKVVKFSGARAD